MMKGPQQYGFSGPQQEATSAAFILLPGERRRQIASHELADIMPSRRSLFSMAVSTRSI
jgi:hypothetical protein